MDNSESNYSVLDHPEILAFLFHPRPEISSPETDRQQASAQPTQTDALIPMPDGVVIGGRFHMADLAAANILFFHGNGEIVADYDDLGPLFNQINVNFMAVDYRGYGRSTGQPTVSNMMQDCHHIFEFVRNWLQEHNFTGPLFLMGRSLGSASVLELSARYEAQVDGLIIESGFAYAGPLLRLLGINPEAIGFKEDIGFRNIDKMADFHKPTLIIHAEHDHIIPFSDGQALYDTCPAHQKDLLKISGANHNDIFLRGMPEYMAAIQTIVDRTNRTNA